MCRDEAIELSKHVDDLKQAGAKRVVCLVKENIPDQIEEFRKDFWREELFMDEAKGFFKALGGGELVQEFPSNSSFLMTMMNPFNKNPVKKKLSQGKAKGNIAGEGLVHGGLYVMRKTGVAELSFLEERLGDTCPINQIKEAVQAASAA